MDLRCPKCNSTDLKKVSLAHEQGLFRSEGRTRLRAVVVGGGGPDLVVGRATTHATQQSALSKKLTPPAKWSYLKVIGWSILVFICVGWLVFYVNTITKNTTTVLSPALTDYALLAAAVFAIIVVLVVSHNLRVYPKRFAEWDRSFICQRCGTLFEPF